MHTRIVCGLVRLFSCGLAAIAVPALAQDAASDDIEEIIVTAQNRAESVQDVPIAIDVVGREALEEAGFASMNDMNRVVPALQVTDDQGQIKVTLRGVGTNSNDEAQDTSVVVNVDGEYINRPLVLGAALFDLERTEVLRGPQGTLYGRNSTGGAVNFITRKPGDEFAVNASATVGSYSATRLDAGVDIPMGSIAALRLSGFYDKHDGYFTHPNTDTESGNGDSNGGRATLVLNPSDALSMTFAAEYFDNTYTPGTFAFIDLNAPENAPGAGCTGNGNGYEQVAPAYTETLCIPSNTNFLPSLDREDYASPLFGVGELEDDSTAVRARIDYSFDAGGTLSYIGGYRQHSSTGLRTLPVIYQSFSWVDDTETQSHELRFNGATDGGILYQFGAFLFKETLDRENGFYIQFVGPPGGDGSYLSYFFRKVDSESKSVFGQMDIPFNDNLTLQAGLRYTDNQRDAMYTNDGAFGPMGPTPLFGAGPARPTAAQLTAQAFPLASSEDKVTGLIGLNYTPDDSTLWYGKVSTGFKGGGFDAVGAYKPEENTAFEVGMKKTLGAGYLNASAYYYDYKDLQVAVLLDTNIGGQTFNAGAATIWGLELEGGFELTDRDSVSFSANYLSTEYDELLSTPNVVCIDPPDCGINGIGDLDPTTPEIEQPNYAGNEAPYAPQFILSGSYQHVFELGSSGDLVFSIFSQYRDSYYTDFFNYNDSQQDGYSQTDVNLTWTSASGMFGVQAFARNLENELPLVYGSFVSAGPDDIYNFGFGQPRTYGVRFSVNY
jgi:iron complex outermembrane recepter protein